MSVRRSGKPLFLGWGSHLTHQEREQVKERFALGIGISIALIVVALLVHGWYQDNIAGPAAKSARLNAPAATVGNQTITTGLFHKVVKYREKILGNQLQQLQSQQQQLQAKKSAAAKAQLASIQQQIQQIQQQQSSIQTNVLQQLIDAAVVEQKGPAAGLHISPRAEQAYFHNIEYNQAGGPVHFAQAAKSFGFTVDEFKGLFVGQYELQKMQKVLAAHVKAVQLQAHARHILVASHKTALLVYRLLVNHKASWKQLARQYSQDPASKLKGGNLGWFPRGFMVAPFDHAAFTNPIGDINIVHSQFGWHVLQVLARHKRHLSPSGVQNAKAQALQHWLAKLEVTPYVVKHIVTSQVPLPQNSPPGLNAATGNSPGANGATAPQAPSAPGLPNGQTLPPAVSYPPSSGHGPKGHTATHGSKGTGKSKP